MNSVNMCAEKQQMGYHRQKIGEILPKITVLSCRDVPFGNWNDAIKTMKHEPNQPLKQNTGTKMRQNVGTSIELMIVCFKKEPVFAIAA